MSDVVLTKEQRTNLEKEIDSRWNEVLKMKKIKASVFVPIGVIGLLRKEYIRVVSETIFIKKSDILHNGAYDYSEVYYNGSHIEIKIWCKKHKEYFYQTPANHLNRRGCPKCAGKGLSTEEWIERFREKHGDRYGYDKFVFKNANTKSIFTCPEHGDFEQTPTVHLQGSDCPKCAGRGFSTKEWIQRFKEVHGDRYGYDKFVYNGALTKSIVTCPEHGDFLVTPANHLNRKGCPKCSGKGFSTKEWIDRFRSVHGDRYNYDKFVYRGNNIKSIVTCPEHGDFEQTPSDHLKGKGCPKCAGRSLSNEEWIDRFRSVHGDRYGYGKFVYKGNNIKSIVTCHEHGDFEITPSNHLNGKRGCPKCNHSKGEIQIENYLKQNKIKYETQKRFDGCKHKRSLSFDFYLPYYNLLIEFQGEQHYKPVKHFGGEKKFKQNQKNDQIKRDFCSKEENPNLLEIKYNETKDIQQQIEDQIFNAIQQKMINNKKKVKRK